MAEPDKEWEVGVCVLIRSGVMRRLLKDFFILDEVLSARNKWLKERWRGDVFVNDIYKATLFATAQHADDYMRSGYPAANYDLYRVRSNATLVSTKRITIERQPAFCEPLVHTKPSATNA